MPADLPTDHIQPHKIWTVQSCGEGIMGTVHVAAFHQLAPQGRQGDS